MKGNKELFLIATVGRTGSTYFTQWLNGFVDIRCHEELLNTSNTRDSIYHYWNSNLLRKVVRKVFGDSKTEFKNNRFTRYLIKNFLLSLLHNPSHSAPWDSYEGRRSFFRQTSKDRNAHLVGFKLIPGDVKYFGNVLKTENLVKTSKVILLVRQNLLASHVSFLKAQQTGFYHTSQDSTATDKKQKIKVPLDSLLKSLAHLKNEEVSLMEFFKDHERLVVSYEEFFFDHERVKPLILDFLKPQSSEQEKQPNLKKTSAIRLSDNIDNYEEVCNALADTPYKTYLND